MYRVPRTCSAAAGIASGFFALAAITTPASAVSLGLELACSLDYFAYCSDHDPDGPGVRKCMRAHGLKLSKVCVKALISEGEISQAEVDAIAKAAGKK